MAVDRGAEWEVALDCVDFFVIRDCNRHGRRSVTNDAEAVLALLARTIRNRRFLYFDSEGRLDEILHNGAGQFVGFVPVSFEDRQRVRFLIDTTRAGGFDV